MAKSNRNFAKQGAILRKYRKLAGYTQKKMADCLGLSESSIKKYEYGEILPKLDQLMHLNLCLQIEGDDLDELLSHYRNIFPVEKALYFGDVRNYAFVEFLLTHAICISGTHDEQATIVIGNPRYGDGCDYECSEEYIVSLEDLGKIEKETANYAGILIRLLGKQRDTTHGQQD